MRLLRRFTPRNDAMDKAFYVYILTNQYNRVLYTGVTNNLKRRVFEHKQGAVEGFTKRYHVKKLVYSEVADTAYAAIGHEKQIKSGSRQDKLNLINGFNPKWADLYDDI